MTVLKNFAEFTKRLQWNHFLSKLVILPKKDSIAFVFRLISQFFSKQLLYQNDCF